MPNMDPKKCPMPSQEPNVRNKNFKEVALGYTEEMAINEAKRCLQCKNHPCRSGCPVEIDIPGFIKHEMCIRDRQRTGLGDHVIGGLKITLGDVLDEAGNIDLNSCLLYTSRCV